MHQVERIGAALSRSLKPVIFQRTAV